jgi:hypothetical protein
MPMVVRLPVVEPVARGEPLHLLDGTGSVHVHHHISRLAEHFDDAVHLFGCLQNSGWWAIPIS